MSEVQTFLLPDGAVLAEAHGQTWRRSKELDGWRRWAGDHWEVAYYRSVPEDVFVAIEHVVTESTDGYFFERFIVDTLQGASGEAR